MNDNDRRKPTIVGVGETLWDVFPDGPRFGGAPANFTCSAAALAGVDARVEMLSGVGQDDLGRRALKAFAEHEVGTRAVAQSEYPTGQVLVQIDDEGQASYEFARDTAWDNLSWTSEMATLAASADAVCFGTLGQRSLSAKSVIQQFVGATAPDCLRVLDVNLRAPYWCDEMLRQSLPIANVLKCNEEELPVLASLFELAGDERSQLRQLAERFSYQMVALTRGSRGSVLINQCGGWSEQAAGETSVVDTVGAGDSFTATVVIGMLRKLSLPQIHAWANRVSTFVCSQPGATPIFPEDLKRAKG